VIDQLDVRIFLRTPHDVLKQRRNDRHGYHTAGKDISILSRSLYFSRSNPNSIFLYLSRLRPVFRCTLYLYFTLFRPSDYSPFTRTVPILLTRSSIRSRRFALARPAILLGSGCIPSVRRCAQGYLYRRGC
jgi:hypothetical protein